MGKKIILNEEEAEQISGGLAIDRIEEVRKSGVLDPQAEGPLTFGAAPADGLAGRLADGLAASLANALADGIAASPAGVPAPKEKV